MVLGLNSIISYKPSASVFGVALAVCFHLPLKRKKKVHSSSVCYYSYRITAHHLCLHCVYTLYIIITRVLPKVTSTRRCPANNTRRHKPAETALKGFSEKMGERGESDGVRPFVNVSLHHCVRIKDTGHITKRCT